MAQSLVGREKAWKLVCAWPAVGVVSGGTFLPRAVGRREGVCEVYARKVVAPNARLLYNRRFAHVAEQRLEVRNLPDVTSNPASISQPTESRHNSIHTQRF